ncbi:MAG: carbamoyl phosphate synthase small subunit [Deltaproteobacteria bacterium]|nr:MAG: carbamoyl phosphate synthase small subunit [Deltaproteobacteria bacterium]
MQKHCYIALADGKIFPGYSFGAIPPRTHELDKFEISKKGLGEVVFNTGMSGYHEILTDPSYTGQIVTMTYPHAGNYGNNHQWSETGPEKGKRLTEIKLAGLVVKKLYRGPVPEGRTTLDRFMRDNNTPGITGIDTRKLTLYIRDNGSPKGIIVRPSDSKDKKLTDNDIEAIKRFIETIPEMEGQNLVKEVGSLEKEVINPNGKIHMAVVDCGIKANIIRELTCRNCKISLFPYTASAKEILDKNTDGILISNGPGDPAVLGNLTKTIKALIGKKPLFGICLGHQLISQALGGKTYKMKFGHHGLNHPVRDMKTERVFVTSQNHGFAVDSQTLPENVKERFINANDKSQEGIVCKNLNIITTQFHPEAAPGPVDSSWIFDDFVECASNF